jgi:hypothetical protein
MPAGTLSQQDRQQIAVGLADGLVYAEMARRLDRPTSTILGCLKIGRGARWPGRSACRTVIGWTITGYAVTSLAAHQARPDELATWIRRH